MRLKTLVGCGILSTVCALASAQQNVADGPSFNCAKARAKNDKAVCADRTLSALDKQAAELFALALSQVADPTEITKAQRQWVRERNDCADAACLAQSYTTRIDALSTLTGKFRASIVQLLCARFESPETRAETLAQKLGSEDINNDGKPETATSCEGGASNVPCVAYVDERGQPVNIQPQGFESNMYSTAGRAAFRYENRTFVYYSRDTALAEPSHLSYITPTNREVAVCDFDTHAGSAVVEGGDDVCAAVESNNGIEPVELAPAEDRKANAFGRADTFIKSLGTVDIDNDGLDDPVIELRYERGDAQACTFNYFEILTEDRRAPLENAKSVPTQELQGLRREYLRDRQCGNVENRLFEFENKIYYETNTGNTTGNPHEIRVLDGTAVATLCTLERQVTTRVRTVF